MNHLSDLRSTKNLSEHIEAVAPDTDAPSVSIRVSPNSYLSAFLIGTFISGFMLYLEMERSGFVLFLISWVAIPFLAFSDYIVFDGKRLSRTGILPRIWASLNRSRRRLRITDIEHVDSQFVRALKRGGNVYYRYRTAIRGRDVSIVITSGGEDYRKMINRMLPLVPENVLDIRSIELRDYLGDPKEIKMKAAFAKMPDTSLSFDVLKNPWLIGGLLLGNLLHFLVIYTDTLNHIFYTAPIPLADFFLIGLIGSSVLWAEEVRKWFARRKLRQA